MSKLTRGDLLTLEAYAAQRAEFRARAIAHKRLRTLHLGPSMTLLFEDRLTVQYQVQEMLRIERVFEPDAIQEELDAYNPLVPDGTNLKATLLLEFPEIEERTRELERLREIERHVFAEVDGAGRAEAHVDEDLERSNAAKTSAVHFVRFEFSAAQRAALRAGAALRVGIDDARYPHVETIAEPLRAELSKDLA
ncbi:MAG TPA: DUF3501 family protein [Xanthomonadales bacterium]|nr:DUF3501 family protein [Xanthomonadales bacterium]